MHSLDKIREHLDELLGPPTPDASPLELMLRTVIGVAAPALESILPSDPEALDRFLEHAAAHILHLRSDSAPLSEGFLMEIVDIVERDGAELGETFASRLAQLWHDLMAAHANPPAAAALAPGAETSTPASSTAPSSEPAPAPASEPAPAPASETAPETESESARESADSTAPSTPPSSAPAPASPEPDVAQNKPFADPANDPVQATSEEAPPPAPPVW